MDKATEVEITHKLCGISRSINEAMSRVIYCEVDGSQGFDMWTRLDEARQATTELVLAVHRLGSDSRLNSNE